jgi:putative ABC transport system permease protein
VNESLNREDKPDCFHLSRQAGFGFDKTTIMLINYFKAAWRALNRYKAYSIINILGLSLGISSCLIIFLVVKYELGYDRFNKKFDRTYRVTLHALDFNPCISLGIASAMRHDFPELEQVTQVWFHQSAMIKVGETRYSEKGYVYADEHIADVFDYEWMEGNPHTALTEPNTVVLTATIAKKFFGPKDPVGQIINLDNRYNLRITGVIKDLPGNTHLPFGFLVSFETIKKDVREIMAYFYAIPDGSFTYIVRPKNVSIQQIQGKIKAFIAKNWGNEIAKEAALPLQPLADIHFDQRYLNNTISYTTSKETYWALSAVAAFIIIIASINFINLATAQSFRRAREVGVRKVLGSTRSQLITQFLSETTFMVMIAVFLGVLGSYFLLPVFAQQLDIKIENDQLAQSSIIILTLSLTLVVILLAGLYPAFVQSSFRPIESLKSKAGLSLHGLTLRKILVVVQFAISQIMIVGTLVVAYQMDFFQNQDLGFNKDAVISFRMPDPSKREVLRQKLRADPGVRDISFSSGAPVLSHSFTSFNSPESGIPKDDVTELRFADENYPKMFDLKMLAGHQINRTNKSDQDTAYEGVVNETMIHKLGITDPRNALGKRIIVNGNWSISIIGVVQDFQSESKHKKIRPYVLLYRASDFYMASVRLESSRIKKTISNIDKLWSGLYPDDLFIYEFLDDHIANWYRQEQKEFTAFKIFSCIAVLIGCLGLYGLIAFAAAQRVKEVGIRKVLGASLIDIILLFSKEFILLIIIAFLIATPVAYLVMHNWLESFAYRINIGPEIFGMAIVTSLMIAAITIAYQAIKAGIANPVGALKSE